MVVSPTTGRPFNYSGKICVTNVVYMLFQLETSLVSLATFFPAFLLNSHFLSAVFSQILLWTYFALFWAAISLMWCDCSLVYLLLMCCDCSLVHVLLDEIVGSTVHRCLDAVTMEPSVSPALSLWLVTGCRIFCGHLRLLEVICKPNVNCSCWT